MEPDFDALQKEVDQLWNKREATVACVVRLEREVEEAVAVAGHADLAWTTSMNVLVRKRKAAGQTWNRGAERWE